jgi:hypothetical protein
MLALVMLSVGVCQATNYSANRTPVSSFWTSGWTNISATDKSFPSPATGNSIVYVQATGTTQVSTDQMAYGLYTTVYTSDNQVLTGVNVPLMERPGYTTSLQRTPFWGSTSNPASSGIYYNGPNSYRNITLHADSTHYSAESMDAPSSNYDVVMSNVSVVVRLNKHTTGAAPAQQEGAFAVVDGVTFKLQKYDLQAVRSDIEQRGFIRSARSVMPDELSGLLSGKVQVPNWSLENIKQILGKINMYEASELMPEDSRPVYWFSQDGHSVTIGFKKLDGSVSVGTVSLGN